MIIKHHTKIATAMRKPRIVVVLSFCQEQIFNLQSFVNEAQLKSVHLLQEI